MGDNLTTLSNYLQNILSCDPVREKQKYAQATQFLDSSKGSEGFCTLCLQFFESPQFSEPQKTFLAIFLKNFIKSGWDLTEESTVKVPESERALIKEKLLQLAMRAPASLRKFFCASITEIATHDFPEMWNELMPTLATFLDVKDPEKIAAALELSSSLFEKYGNVVGEQVYLRELKFHILTPFEPRLRTIFVESVQQLLSTDTSNEEALALALAVLNPLVRCFYCLNHVDLPEEFEDNMETWMKGFSCLLDYQHPGYRATAKKMDVASPLDTLHQAVIDSLALYAQRYPEFENFIRPFTEKIYTFLIAIDTDPYLEPLASVALQYLTFVAAGTHSEIFADNSIMNLVCTNAILPSIAFTERDEENFEMEPFEYIQQEIEGSNTETRRRHALELIKALCRNYEAEVSAVFLAFIQNLLQEFNAKPEKNWKAKNSAINMVIALAAKTAITDKGVAATNQNVDIVSFFTQHIVPELQSQSNLVVLKADALKFITLLRLQLPPESVPSLLPLVVAQLSSPSCVVHSYAAHWLERILVTHTTKTSPPLLTREMLKPHLTTVLTSLFSIFSHDDSAENQYAMKALMRVTAVSKEDCVPFINDIIAGFTAMLSRFMEKQGNLRFLHFLFETVASLIRHLCPNNISAVSAFEDLLFPHFQNILQSDAPDLTPYVFQIMALLLESRPPPIHEKYMALLGPILTPALYENQGNVPALTRFVSTFIEKGANQIVKANHLLSILGIFQRLLGSKKTDTNAFEIIFALVQFVDLSVLQPHLGTIFQLIFARYMKVKYSKLGNLISTFVAFFAIGHGTNTCITAVESVQPGLFWMFVQNILCLHAVYASRTLSPKYQRVLCVGLCKILECSTLMEPGHEIHAGSIITGCAAILVSQYGLSLEDDEAYTDPSQEDFTSGQFCRLAYADTIKTELLESFEKSDLIFCRTVTFTLQAHPQIAKMLQQTLDSEQTNNLKQVFARNNLPVPITL